MSPIASAVRRTGPARRAAAVGVLALLAVVPGLPAAHAEPSRPDYWVYDFADFAASPAVTDYDHRTVTLTGTLLRHRRWGGPEEPAPAEAVELVQSAAGAATGAGGAPGDGTTGGTPPATVVTDDRGGFRLDGMEVRPPAGGPAAPGPSTVEVRAVHTTDEEPEPVGDGLQDATTEPTAGRTADGTAEARLDIVATASTARLTVDYRLEAAAGAGRTVTAQGALERDTPQGPRPVSGAGVRIEYRTAGEPPLVKEEATGSDGRFSVTFPAAGGGTLSAALSGPADPYLDTGGADGLSRRLDVPPPLPTATADPAASSVRSGGPAVHRATAAPPASRPRATRTVSAAAPPKPVLPADGPHILAETGGASPRLAFLTGGSTLVLAGLLLMVVRRRMRVSG